MQFIVDFKDSTPINVIQQYLTENNCQVVSVFSSFGGVFVVESDSTPPITDIVEAIVQDSDNPIDLLSTIEVQTDDANDWWKIAVAYKPNFDAPTQTYERRGQFANIYLVDSGINSLHPEFANAQIENLFSFNGNFDDTTGHGTALASVMVGETCGMSSAKVKSVKIFHSGVSTLQSHLLAAFDAIIQDVVANPNKLAIVNMSWSIPKNAFIESKIKILVDAGASVICAAGNAGMPISDVTPASMEEVFVVGAFDENLEPCDFSNYTGDLSFTQNTVNSGALDVWAPGTNIRVALVDGTVGKTSGTSVAAAIQSAAVAYNSYIYVLSDGTIPAIFLDGNWAFGYASGKQGMMILEDQYASSINKMTNYHTEIDGDNGLNHRVSTRMKFVLKSGVDASKILFPQNMVRSTTLRSEDLPAGLRLDNAWMLGIPNVQEPLTWETDFTYTKHNGTEVNTNLKILILPENMTIEESPLDSEVKLTFSALCSSPTLIGGYWYCDGTCELGGPCYDACMAEHKAGGGPPVSGPGGLTGFAAPSAGAAQCECYTDFIVPCGG